MAPALMKAGAIPYESAKKCEKCEKCVLVFDFNSGNFFMFRKGFLLGNVDGQDTVPVLSDDVLWLEAMYSE